MGRYEWYEETPAETGHFMTTPGLSLVARVLCVYAAFACMSGIEAKDLSFEERVQAQEGLERVYWKHRIWPTENKSPKPSFESLPLRTAIEARVADYLRESDALKNHWKTPIDANMIRSEIERIVRNTGDSEVLKELFQALGNDPFLIEECLARPLVSDRVIREQYMRDSNLGGSSDPLSDPRESDFEQWWQLHKNTYSIDPTPIETSPTVLPVVSSAACLDDTWTPVGVSATSPSVRSRHTAVWTGVELIIWGGLSTKDDLNTGARYYPATDSWLPTNHGLAPAPRWGHTAVWTGKEMIVWGGVYGLTHLWYGGRYDPMLDSWKPTKIDPLRTPSPRSGHAAVWTGTRMLIWGGYPEPTGTRGLGASYDPERNQWYRMSQKGAPSIRSGCSALWTGRDLMIWGGFDEDQQELVRTGSRFRADAGHWKPIRPGGPELPTARSFHSAIWTGQEMIVWGGFVGPSTLETGNDGFRYRPHGERWTETGSGPDLPEARRGHAAVWTGHEMVIWGGWPRQISSEIFTLNTGARYDPQADVWRPLSLEGAPSPRSSYTATWTGHELLIWGGEDRSVEPVSLFGDGARYCAAP